MHTRRNFCCIRKEINENAPRRKKTIEARFTEKRPIKIENWAKFWKFKTTAADFHQANMPVKTEAGAQVVNLVVSEASEEGFESNSSIVDIGT